ncbi:platelet-activating factor acetylhydrolase IB subunit alpha2-like [Haliotis cracherodii]|uniref:platelet-activating factor acetylhydrolase IB subunit alpha2-like n=1 Tax=Haliotis cracherodii TaxID=6455 RepID=UPI0039E8010E
MNPAAEAQVVEDVQGDGRWMSLHKRFLLEAKEREPEVVFIGDSLIAQLQHMPIWQQMFEPLHCLNFGIGADQTQHVLWRVQNGELDNMEPKVVVMLVGTNNHDHTGEQVVGGIMELVSAIHTKQPQAQVVVMGIPPRGENRNHLREKILQINTSLAEQLKGKGNVTFLNIDASWFVNADGTITHHDMHDYLHMTRRGYQKICEPLLEEIQNLLQTFVKVESTSVETVSMAGELAGDKA